jgi:Cys-Gly metallodipeptidase DUG1
LKKPFIDRLAAAVAIPSVSADASFRPEVHRMATFLAKELESLGAEYYPISPQLIKGLNYVLWENMLCKM